MSLGYFEEKISFYRNIVRKNIVFYKGQNEKLYSILNLSIANVL